MDRWIVSPERQELGLEAGGKRGFGGHRTWCHGEAEKGRPGGGRQLGTATDTLTPRPTRRGWGS